MADLSGKLTCIPADCPPGGTRQLWFYRTIVFLTIAKLFIYFVQNSTHYDTLELFKCIIAGRIFSDLIDCCRLTGRLTRQSLSVLLYQLVGSSFPAMEESSLDFLFMRGDPGKLFL